MTTQTFSASPVKGASQKKWVHWAYLALMLYFLLLAVDLIGSGFKLAAGEQAQMLFAFAAHPVAGLMIGIIATAFIQSSSTVTSIIVGLVAGGLPFETAIPMIMGANIGTTVTNTLVSLGHARCKEEFRRAFTCATVHDFFNLLAVMIFLPLEIAFGVLAKVSAFMLDIFSINGNLDIGNANVIGSIIKPVIATTKSFLASLPHTFSGILMITVGIVLLFIAITAMGRLLRMLMVGRAKEMLQMAIGKGPLHGILSGTIVTVLVQSSSTTTSMMVPLVGTNVLTVREVYPFTLGANIGTCITALLAATAVSGPNAQFALQIAFVHLAFNVLATVLIFGVPFLRNIPLHCAQMLGNAAAKTKWAVAIYLGLVFVAIPAAMMLLTV
ncbi:MAG: Na/Pi symporter [Enterovibrio sp.]